MGYTDSSVKDEKLYFQPETSIKMQGRDRFKV